MTALPMVSLRITDARDVAVVVKRLRQTVGVSVADLAVAVRTQQPIVVRRLQGLDHDEAEGAVLGLLGDLEAMMVEVAVIVDGEEVSKQYLLNIFERYRGILHDVRMEMEWESGDPSDEARDWARRHDKK